ncbi:MAG: hypothetical protein WCT05_12720 [Lentisphaeria bacterium]
MRQFSFIMLLGVAFSLVASEPIWRFDEKNVQISDQHSTTDWFGKNIKISADPDGGFIVGSTVQRYFSLKPDHWLVFELAKAEPLGGPSTYHAWSLFYPVKGIAVLLNNVTTIETGLFTIRLSDLDKAYCKAGTIYAYNLNLHFKYIQLEKNPENSLCAEIEENKTMLKPGDKFRIVLKLKEPCEDVSCKLEYNFGRYPIPFVLNGTDSVELKPADKEGKLWTADITIQNYKTRHEISKRSVTIKVVVLGGKLGIPIYGKIPAAFYQENFSK